MPEYSRPPGFRFTFSGLNLLEVPDALAQDKYTVAQNIRADAVGSIRTRPGYATLFSIASSRPITDIKAYASLGTDDLPRFLCRDDQNRIYLDSGPLGTTMGGLLGSGVIMIPFRPGASPQSWMYVCSQEDYQKISAPNSLGAVTAQKVGIAEPQTACDAAPTAPQYTDVSSNAAGWTNSGTAGALSDATRSTDTVVAIFADSVVSSRYSVQIAPTVTYQQGEVLTFNKSGGGTFSAVVQDVIPPIPAAMTIAAIRYVSGSTGHCYLVPTQMPIGAGGIGTLRRGALIKLKNTEVVLVWSVVEGIDGSVCIETSTVGTYVVGDAVAGIPALIVDGISALVVGQTVSSACISSSITVGIGQIFRTFAAGTNPFANVLGTSALLPQNDDFIHCSILVSDYTQINEIKILFNIDAGVATFDTNAMMYSIRPSDLAKVVTSNQTLIQAQGIAAQIQTIEDQIASLQANYNIPYQAREQAIEQLQNALAQLQAQQSALASPPEQSASGSNQWTEVMFPITDLIRIGDDQNRSLATCTGLDIVVNAISTVTVKIGSIWIGGGGQPDTGDSGAEYAYRAVPRNVTAGAKGNGSPTMRYGVHPRRQPVTVKLPSASYDSQIDTWDIERYGGTIPSWRWIGSAPSTATTFSDNYFDDAASAGDEMEVDNFEPWPSVDLPYSVSSGGGTTITVVGTWITISGPTSWPANIGKWMPGTLIELVGLGSVTLRARPTRLSSTSYLFEIEECFGSNSPTKLTIQEPKVANQHVPYIWGPNENGDIFAVGDPLRPGTIYISKSNNPDSAPDSFNVDITDPSRPLLGGACLIGKSLAGSTDQWWALYPSFTTTQRYTPIPISIGRNLISPYAHCTDKASLYFWMKDGIGLTAGSGYENLIDADLRTLFPHEGVSGQNITRNGVTFYAPDYRRVATFRLAVGNGFLIADYQDSTGTPRTLVCDLRRKAWSTDVYHDPICIHYFLEQQPATITGLPISIYPSLVMCDTAGKAWKQQDLSNDNASPIAAVVSTFEFDGGDLRAGQEWGDFYIALSAPAGATVTPQSNGSDLVSGTAISASASRQFTQVSVGGHQLANSVGLKISWTDNFSSQSIPTRLDIWQPSFIPKPEISTDRYGDWEDGGFYGSKYFRGFKIRADTFNVSKSIGIRSRDDNSLRTQAIQHNGEETLGYAFASPFVSHLVRREPQDSTPWRYFGTEWIFDQWPELTREFSPWLDLKTPGSKYLRGIVLPVNSGGVPARLRVISSDSDTATLGPFTTAMAVKSPLAFAFTIPLIGKEFQIQPLDPCRVWWDEARWDFDLWPELINEATGWLKVFQNGSTAYLQGLRLPVETAGVVPALSLLFEDGTTVALVPIGTPVTAIKTPITYSLATPKVCRAVQIVPTQPCRIWLNEIEWIAQPAPDLAKTWATPFTGHGLRGYHSIPYIDAAYSSSAPVTLTYTAFDGTSPNPVTLPSTGGVYQKVRIVLTPNKGMLFSRSAVSASAFQLFLNDWCEWVSDWGRTGAMTPYRNLGSEFGDKAPI